MTLNPVRFIYFSLNYTLFDNMNELFGSGSRREELILPEVCTYDMISHDVRCN
jgi:hypothetical protein